MGLDPFHPAPLFPGTTAYARLMRSGLAILAIGFAASFLPESARAQSPVWNWATTYDLGNEEWIRDIAIDNSTGSVYVVGAYQTPNFAASTPFGLPLTYNQGVDGFLAKLDLNGTLIWSVRIGGVQPDAITGVVISSSGSVYITGHYGSALGAPWS